MSYWRKERRHFVNEKTPSPFVPIIAEKIRPNDQCPCGSGKKAKNCHGTETRYYKQTQFEDRL